MNLATFNRYRRTGVTNTTRALEALFRARPPAVVAALDTAPFRGLPEPFLGALRGLSREELKHISDWPDADKERVRVAVLDAIRTNQTVRFRWKLHEPSQERTTIVPDGPGAIKITFYSPWDNLRVLGRGEVCVDASPGG
jgi:hypothetical protein